MERYVHLDQGTIKKLSKLQPSRKNITEMCKKIAFSSVMHSKVTSVPNNPSCCCGNTFKTDVELKKHLSVDHSKTIASYAENIEEQFYRVLKSNTNDVIPSGILDHKSFKFLLEDFECTCFRNFKVVLYYCYTDVSSPMGEATWQDVLCHNLNLKGKIRVAREGINGTAEGCLCAIDRYIKEMLNHFPVMEEDDFKLSDGDGMAFKDLKISQCEELCSMGISTEDLKPTDGGRHLSPEEFHEEIQEAFSKKKEDTILLDCRNFYESRIGYFEDAVRPDLRKFSYFPTYVDKNTVLFKDKRVLMYCTGGIRCERASAYIKKSGVCKEVLQLKGGIHKYLEKYPHGHYKGKLFVFDQRYSIGGETQSPVSNCKYCNELYDHYELCTSPSRRQLVLSCHSCRAKGKTACCMECQENKGTQERKEECECTRLREQAPVENLNKI